MRHVAADPDRLIRIACDGDVVDLDQKVEQRLGIVGAEYATDPLLAQTRVDLAEVVRAKQAGESVKARAPAKTTNVVSLIDALRESAKATGAATAEYAEPASRRARTTRSKPARAKPRRRAAN